VPGTSATSASCKVIHADGRVTRLARPVRASELMLDNPGQFVCDACRLAVGCRVPGVAADELLQPRRAYFLLPIDMLYSVLTDDEMAALSAASHGALAAATSAWKRIVTSTTAARRRGGTADRQTNGDGGRVFPVVGLLQLHDDHGGNNGAGHASAGAKSRGGAAPGGLRRHRSWKPVLDTIDEAP
jgi:hypothetical protein